MHKIFLQEQNSLAQADCFIQLQHSNMRTFFSRVQHISTIDSIHKGEGEQCVKHSSAL